MRPVLRIFLLVCWGMFDFAKTSEAQQSILASSDLPIVMVNTNGQTILNDPKITANMGVIYNGPGKRNNIGDPANEYKIKLGLK